MTDEIMSLRALLEKSADADFAARDGRITVELRLMELEVENLTGAAHGERSPDRINHRSGYRDRDWRPERAPSSCASPSSERGATSRHFSIRAGWTRRRSAAVIQEAYVQGVSTRSVDELVKAMGMTGISKSQVSRLRSEIDDKISAFLDRPLEGDWPYLWLDATFVKVRQNGRIVSVAVIVAVAVNGDGRREVLGMAIGPSEAETFWTAFLRTLARRGLRGVKLVISDAHEGLKAAVAKVLHASWQRCRGHFMRQCAGPRRQAGASRRRRLHRHRVCPGGCRNRAEPVAPSRRSNQTQGRQAGRPDGRGRNRRAGFYEFPQRPQAEDPLDQSAGTAERRDQAPHRGRRHLPQ